MRGRRRTLVLKDNIYGYLLEWPATCKAMVVVGAMLLT